VDTLRNGLLRTNYSVFPANFACPRARKIAGSSGTDFAFQPLKHLGCFIRHDLWRLCNARHTGWSLGTVRVGANSKEVPVQSSYLASTKTSTKASFLHLSPDLATVILFCLVGLVISAALIPYLAAEDIGSILAYLN
jgi:hypothetical protein